MTGALHQVLKKQVECARRGLANFALHAVHTQPPFLADIVIEARIWCERAVFDFGHERSLGYPKARGRPQLSASGQCEAMHRRTRRQARPAPLAIAATKPFLICFSAVPPWR